MRKEINTISKESAKRFKTFFGVEANIIYPPVVRLKCDIDRSLLKKGLFFVGVETGCLQAC